MSNDMTGAGIIELFPSAQGPPVHRIVTAPRDLASVTLLWAYCIAAAVQVVLAVAIAGVAGVFLHTNKTCLISKLSPDSEQLESRRLCDFTYAACAITLPICAGVMAVELLPDVSPGVRNLVPLVLDMLGSILWGIEATAMATVLHGGELSQQRPLQRAALNMAWANMTLFVVITLVKLLSPVLGSAIDATSTSLSRLCPEGCMPACDACCCLDVATARVPREVLRQGRVLVRFMAWNQEGQEGGGLAGLQPLAPGAAPPALGMLR